MPIDVMKLRRPLLNWVRPTYLQVRRSMYANTKYTYVFGCGDGMSEPDVKHQYKNELTDSVFVS